MSASQALFGPPHTLALSANLIYMYILAGYPASLGTLPLSPPSLGLPGFEQNISSVIAQNNSIPEIRFKH